VGGELGRINKQLLTFFIIFLLLLWKDFHQ
jgi:hypothetical protein